MSGNHKTNFKGTLLLMLEDKDGKHRYYLELNKDVLNERISQRDK
jgi:hypothetical protein